ncbi:MAG: glycine oxidase ThiO [Thermoanaerobaculia bacterium]
MNADVVIHGAGIIGCAIAREVAAGGLSVVVVERNRPGEEASGAAAGLLTPQSHASSPGPLADLGRASLDLYPALARELAEETSIDVDLRMSGSVRIAADEDDERELAELFEWQDGAGWRLARLDAEGLARRTVGALHPRFRAGLEFSDEGSVDCRLLVRALWKSARARGARFRLGESVRALAFSGDRCTGVVTDAETIGARVVVDAAGPWAGLLGGLPVSIPVRPVRGQIVELVAEDVPFPFPVSWRDFYVVPRAGGRVLLGSTQEEAGFDKRVTAGAVALLIARAVEVLPRLRAARFSGAWAGLRPASPDSLPLLGESGVPGLLIATGHFRNGILLAPVTARALAALILGRDPPVSLEPFRVERFAFAPRNESW